MNRQDYRNAFDRIAFDEDFQEKTILALRRKVEQSKERKVVPMNKKRMTLVAAALSVALIVSAAAAVVMLRPQDVARRAGNSALADAFESESAIAVDETRSVGDYAVTLMGLVSGQELSALDAVDYDERTYAVLAMSRLDGEPIAEAVPDLTVTPLVEGYAPWHINAWTLNGGFHTFAEEGVLYYLIECDTLEPFADHTVYLAVYPGTHVAPNAELFAFDAATGSITARENQESALFTLPLDPAKADPRKVQEMVGEYLLPTVEEQAEDSPAEEAPASEENSVLYRLVDGDWTMTETTP